MPHPSRRLVITLVAIAATLGFVGVSAAVEGEDPSLGEPELTCPDVSEGTTDDGGGADEGVTTDDATGVTDEGTDATDATDGGTDTTDEATDEATDDGTAATDGTDTTDDGTDDGSSGGDDCEDAGADTDGATDDGTSDATDDGTTDEGETDIDGTDDGAAPESADVENHGAAVSAAAHECPPGPEHGPCVREVAHSDAGKKAKGGDDAGTEDDEVVEDDSAEASEDDVVEDEGDDGSEGHGKGHGGAKHEQ